MPARGDEPTALAPNEDQILDAALAAARLVSPPHSRASAVIDVAEAYAGLGFRRKAEDAIEEALADLADVPTAEHMLVLAAEACLRSELHGPARRMAARMTGPGRAVRVLCPVALALRKAGRPEDALATAAEAEARAAELGEGKGAVHAWTAIAKAYARLGEPERFRAALERALAQLPHVPGEAERRFLLENIAEMCAMVGRLDEALNLAGALADDSKKVKLTCLIAESFAQGGDDDRALALLESAGHEADLMAAPHLSAQALLWVAESYHATGHVGLAEQMLARAERMTESVENERHAADLRGELSAVYELVGDLSAAERVVERGSPEDLRTGQALRLMRLQAKRGDHEAAVATIARADPGYLSLSGKANLRGIAEVYYEAWGKDAGLGRLTDLQPRELRDAVLAHYAAALAGDEDYRTATRLAQAVEFEVTKDEALMAVADACLAAARSEADLQPAREVLDVMVGRLDQLRLRVKLASRLAELAPEGASWRSPTGRSATPRRLAGQPPRPWLPP